MGHIESTCYPHTAFLDALRVVGEVAKHLPYGISEPVLRGTSATSLYTGGMWNASDIELFATEPVALTAALVAAGFVPDDAAHLGSGKLRRSGLRCTFRIATDCSGLRAAIATNTVRVDVGINAAAIEGFTRPSLRVIGIEDLIADQIVAWLAQGGRQGEAAVLSQVLVELGWMGVGGLFRPAYLQRRLDRETNGEAVFELPDAASPLDNLSPRHTSLTAIASVVDRWRSRRGLYNDVHENSFADALATAPSCADRCRNDQEEREGQAPAPGARIIPFPMNRANPTRDSGG